MPLPWSVPPQNNERRPPGLRPRVRSLRLNPGDLHARLSERGALAEDVRRDRAGPESRTVVLVAHRVRRDDGERRGGERPDLVLDPGYGSDRGQDAERDGDVHRERAEDVRAAAEAETVGLGQPGEARHR